MSPLLLLYAATVVECLASLVCVSGCMFAGVQTRLSTGSFRPPRVGSISGDCCFGVHTQDRKGIARWVLHLFDRLILLVVALLPATQGSRGCHMIFTPETRSKTGTLAEEKKKPNKRNGTISWTKTRGKKRSRKRILYVETHGMRRTRIRVLH